MELLKRNLYIEQDGTTRVPNASLEAARGGWSVTVRYALLLVISRGLPAGSAVVGLSLLQQLFK